MSLAPTWELGLWNAWLLNLPELFFWPAGSWLLQRRGIPPTTPCSENNGQALIHLLTSMIVGSYAYSLFVPLQRDTVWFYVGLLLYGSGTLIESLALHTFAVTPVDQPVTSGIYGVSRNPMYMGEVLKRSGTGLACVSWLYTVLAITEFMLWRRVVLLEERECLARYGAAYQEYMNRTPRWTGIPSRKARR